MGSFLLSLVKRNEGNYIIDASLGRNLIKLPIEITRNSIRFDNVEIPKREIIDIVNNKRRIYALNKDSLIPLSVYDENENIFYQLVLFEGNKVPTVELSGIHMHRTVVDPLFVDARNKIILLNPRPYKLTLEICTGLGYTTYWLLKKKQGIITIEKSRHIIKLAEHNPWSIHLENNKVKLINADAVDYIISLPDKTFDYILHDPPRISIAPELYDTNFYRELYRVLKPSGKIFHYTGYPGRKQGKRFLRGIIERLRLAGFRRIKFKKSALGIVAYK